MMARGYMLVICASDSRGGAGLQAALAQAALIECECRTVLTSVTVQSHEGVEHAEAVSCSLVRQQFESALKDGLPNVVLIGWLPPDPAMIGLIRELLTELRSRTGVQIVWDPVLKSTLGHLPAHHTELMSLLPLVSVITPSLCEARALCSVVNDDHQANATLNADSAARQLQKLGASTVVITGGDIAGDEHQKAWAENDETENDGTENDALTCHQDAGCWITDRVYSRRDEGIPETGVLTEFAMHQRRVSASAHGTGSHFSAAVAAHLSVGERLYDALLKGAAATRQALLNASGCERFDYGNAQARALPEDGDVWPIVTNIVSSIVSDQTSQSIGRRSNEQAAFAPYKPGLYALTDSVEHAKILIRQGIDTLQWRVKDSRPDYREQTLEVLNFCREAGVGFWLNDDWRLALDIHPDGVHLGQEDLLDADIPALRASGVGLGISTHTDWEIARARSFEPSYIAFGPVFPPLSKKLKYPPLGIDRLTAWSKRYKAWPRTCIGGIVPANVAAVAATGVGSFALVTCIAGGPADEPRIGETLRTLRNALDASQSGGDKIN